NLICRYPGASGKGVVFSGHYDTKRLAGLPFVGANDAGSSTGWLLEIARTLGRQKRKHSVYIVFFDGEEAFREYTDTDGLYGSRHLANRWEQDGTLERIIALINVDMIGDSDLAILNEYYSNAKLKELIWSTARRLGYTKQFPSGSGDILDDHVPFTEKGVPAVNLIDFHYGPRNSYWHTHNDTMDKLSAASLEAVGRVLVEVLARLK
ncbi:MAG: Zn-dependent exopeptidase M28, partial [bacterium]|nr:Zn-dependent exopeptidase M28 [bacterium]